MERKLQSTILFRIQSRVPGVGSLKSRSVLGIALDVVWLIGYKL